VAELLALRREVLQWSAHTPVAFWQLMSAGVGMAGPIAVGAASGRLADGMLASIGGLAVSTADVTGPPLRRAARMAATALTGTLGVALGAVLGGRGWAGVGILIALVGVLALVGGISRPLARLSGQLIVLLVLGGGTTEAAATHWGGAAPLVAAGAVAAGCCTLLAATIADALGESEPQPQQQRRRPARALLRRWAGTLRQFAGWRYPLRITLCLAVAEIVGQLWHQPKSYWIALTVAIVVQRQLDGALVRTAQRGFGTLAGVVLGSALLLTTLPTWGLVVAVGVLAAARPLLKVRNYALYAMIMSPLVVLQLDFGQSATLSTMADRLLDTLLGCAIALTLGYLVLPRRHRS